MKYTLIFSGITTMSLIVLTVIILPAPIKAESALYLSSPAAGERVAQGEVIKIQWFQDEVPGAVDIHIWQANHGKWYEVANGVDARLEEITWQVPRSMQGKCRLRIVSAVDRSVKAFGQSFFFIEENQTSNAGASLSAPDDLIRLAPNPSRVSVDINWPLDLKAEQLVIVDLLGMEIERVKLAGRYSLTLQTSGWPSGNYRVQLLGAAGQSWHATLVVKR